MSAQAAFAIGYAAGVVSSLLFRRSGGRVLRGRRREMNEGKVPRIVMKYIYSLVLDDVERNNGMWTIRASIVMEWLTLNGGLPTQAELDAELAAIMGVVQNIKRMTGIKP